MDALETAFFYHEHTKHHPHRYARSLGYMDWANQPNPFRRYEGAPLFLLPFPDPADSPAYDQLYLPEAIASRPVQPHTLSAFLLNALGLSASKEYHGNRWELRCNPSSGNLHPSEGYLIQGGGEDLPAGVYHYAPREHGLELRHAFSQEQWAALSGGFPSGTFFTGLISIHWREAWKYGERAYRYCNQDAGHAFAALSLSAAAQGWRLVELDGLASGDIAALLGLDRAEDYAGVERETPEFLAAVFPHTEHPGWPPQAIKLEGGIHDTLTGPWNGRANPLSADHVPWDIIDTVAAACSKPRTPGDPVSPSHLGKRDEDIASARGPTAYQIFQQRRSAVDMDGVTSITAAAFCGMLRRVMPANAPPWYGLGRPPHIDLGLFVHRVDGLLPGLYCLQRNPNHAGELRASMHPHFTWQAAPDCEGLPLFLLHPVDCREAAADASCHQDIAGDGAFSLGMLAKFEAPLKQTGAWLYPRLFWEAGMIGQVLYLEAEAAGVRATGMGCYFDDVVHHLFGIRDRSFQS
ncbi:MAG: SagB/ThcOx family dehydrogenase, partial [Candidatus Hydrogenedentes bacterium]|nr:SagB/ThcOx family dehydrogenase [Candidatus Hydrogenedentota bacterium]